VLLFQTAVAYQQTQILPDPAVGDCSRWIEGGVKGYETGLIPTDSSALVLLELQP